MVNTITQRLGPEAEQELEDLITVEGKDMDNNNMVNRVVTVDSRVITGTLIFHPACSIYRYGFTTS